MSTTMFTPTDLRPFAAERMTGSQRSARPGTVTWPRPPRGDVRRTGGCDDMEGILHCE